MNEITPAIENLYVRCECESSEHFCVFLYDNQQEDLCIQIYLYDHQKWYKRLLEAIKYVFGYKSKFGHFDTVLISKHNAEKIKELLNKKIK